LQAAHHILKSRAREGLISNIFRQMTSYPRVSLIHPCVRGGFQFQALSVDTDSVVVHYWSSQLRRSSETSPMVPLYKASLRMSVSPYWSTPFTIMVQGKQTENTTFQSLNAHNIFIYKTYIIHLSVRLLCRYTRLGVHNIPSTVHTHLKAKQHFFV
jgi:hypothetical protein